MIEKTQNLILPIFIYLLYGNTAWACPACAGSMENPNSGKIFWILLAFIILIRGGFHDGFYRSF